MSGVPNDKPLIGHEDIFGAISGQVRLALVDRIDSADFERYLGVDPEALNMAAVMAAEEEFEHQHGMGELAVGRLAAVRPRLSAAQRAPIIEALTDTFEVAFRTGMVLAYVRAGIGVDPSDA